MTSATLKILLVEDDELFRLGLAVRLQKETGFEIVAEAGDGETAVELAAHYSLDVVLLDLGLPRMGGLEACQQIHDRHPNLPILILTSREERDLIPRAIDAGARGYCLKGIVSETLVLAIRSVAAGASWWDADATDEIRSRLFPSGEPKSNTSLTEREREIIALVAAGKSNLEIAEQLHITGGTVRVHVHAILQKLGARARRSAVLIARQRNFL
ncbi:MAG: response regulator transcription factor [Microcystis aeruginosa LG13-11]|jgi:two-component system NarL family response regulator|nr:response regulator transcription factor [Microcystis aeruginosa LG13-11]